jgi:deoxyribodipyrimidine photo-lyase
VDTAVVLLTRDLRVHDNPALAAACRVARHVLPMFVLDPSVRSSAGRDRFLTDSLADLRETLRGIGGDLIVRRGDPATETLKVATEVKADGIALAQDASAYARRRECRLVMGAGRRSVKLFPGVTVVPPGSLTPANGDHYKVFTPYWRAWQGAHHRRVEPAPRRVSLPTHIPASVELPAARPGGGETVGRSRVRAWLKSIDGYAEGHDDLAGDRTSRLSPYLHFGCVSPLELVTSAGRSEAFVRQVCWRDFYTQVLYAFPDLTTRAYRPNVAEKWNTDPDALDAWKAGETGVAIVDAGMRQLLAEGWMHNRARLITASYLTKDLGVDWREGAAHFDAHLLDADVANNYGNWQWVAGTGNDSRPRRKFNPERQQQRFDPDGEYVRRWS